MTRITLGAAGLLLASSTMAMALGLDRSGQDITAIFEPGNYAELNFGWTSPTLQGVDLLGNDTGNVGEDFTIVSGALIYAVTPQLSIGVIVDEPYGADVLYEGSPATTLLGGTEARLDTVGVTALARYRLDNGFSFHGGVRHVQADGEVTLSGAAYGGLNGYNVELTDASGWGYVVGGAYERPDIALRVALTYQSEITLDFDTVESIGGAVVAEGEADVIAPESVNLDFQTGIAEGTLLFAQVRWANYSETLLQPPAFTAATLGGSITDIPYEWSYTLGVGRRFTDQLAGRVSVTWEPALDDDLVSPLTPYNGQVALAVGVGYDVTEAVTISGGVRYAWLGDAFAETGTPDAPRAEFSGNTALSVGLSVAYRF